MIFSTFIIIIIIIIIIVYAIFCLKYYYKYNPHIEIMQCNVETFHQNMLQEKNPLMCRELLRMHSFKKLYTSVQKQFSKNNITELQYTTSNSEAIYNSLNIDTILYNKPPIRCYTEILNTPFIRSWHALWFIFQLKGSRRIALYSPIEWENTKNYVVDKIQPISHQIQYESFINASKPKYTEIIIHEGDGIFIPTAWVIQSLTIGKQNISGEMYWNPIFPGSIHPFFWNIVR